VAAEGEAMNRFTARLAKLEKLLQPSTACRCLNVFALKKGEELPKVCSQCGLPLGFYQVIWDVGDDKILGIELAAK
jgi:hypothetical protein